MGRKGVVLPGWSWGQELLDVLLNLGEFRYERISAHLSCNITIYGNCQPRHGRDDQRFTNRQMLPDTEV
jgi:hypothetical protein